MKHHRAGIAAVACLFVGSAWAIEPPADEPEQPQSPQTEPAQPQTQPAQQPSNNQRRIPPEVLQQLIEQQRQRMQNQGRPKVQIPQTPMPEDFESGMNLLADPSFEGFDRFEEGQPWWNSLKVQNSKAWVEFDIAEGEGRTGERAAHLHMDSDEQPGSVRVHGVVQELVPPAMPRYISGWYRVENWERGTEKQYLQTVIIAREPSNPPARIPRARNGSYSVQLAMTLAGAAEPPLRMGNRRFKVSGPLDPVEGEWTFFEFDVHDLYTKLWGDVPQDSKGLRVFFEVRYDRKTDLTPARCDVYFDDLYFGDESRASVSESEQAPTD